MPTPFKVGDRVLLLKPHPHAGKVGIVIDLEIQALVAHLGPRPRIHITETGEDFVLVHDKEAAVREKPTP